MSRVAAILAASGCWYYDPLENFKRWERRTTASKGARLKLVFDEIRQARRGLASTRAKNVSTCAWTSWYNGVCTGRRPFVVDSIRGSAQLNRVGQALRRQLEHGAALLVSPLGFSPTGEVSSLRAEAVATAFAAELHAAKIVLLGETRGLIDREGTLMRELTLDDAKPELARRMHESSDPEPEVTRHLESAIHACRNGVRRTHVVDRHIDGALLLELFTRQCLSQLTRHCP